MAISTNGEAQAVNQLARLIFNLPLNGIPVPDSDTAREALALLADSAYRKYGAGIDGKQVRDLWPRARGCSCNRDPVECNHEAARGQADAVIARLRDGIEDVAIRSLRYCEDRYGHDQARLNLRALLDDTAPAVKERPL
ncbi:hypothetical protein AB0G05_19695 [Nonomuraea wenchangensis]